MRFPRAQIAESGTIDVGGFRELLMRLKQGLFTGYVRFTPTSSFGMDNGEYYMVYLRGVCECAIGDMGQRHVFGDEALRTLATALGVRANYEVCSYPNAPLIVPLFPEGRVSMDPVAIIFAPPRREAYGPIPAPTPPYNQYYPPHPQQPPAYQQPAPIPSPQLEEKERMLREKLARKKQMEAELAALDSEIRSRMLETSQPTPATGEISQGPLSSTAVDMERTARMERELRDLESEIEARRKLLEQLASERGEGVSEVRDGGTTPSMERTPGHEPATAQSPQPKPAEEMRWGRADSVQGKWGDSAQDVSVVAMEQGDINREEMLSKDEIIKKRTMDIKRRIEEELRRKRGGIRGEQSPPVNRPEMPPKPPDVVERPAEKVEEFRPMEDTDVGERPSEGGGRKGRRGKSIFDELVEMNRELRE